MSRGANRLALTLWLVFQVATVLAVRAPRSTSYYHFNGTVQVLPDAKIDYPRFVDGAVVQIVGNYQPVGESLFLHYGGRTVVSSRFNVTSGSVRIDGCALGMAYSRVLRSVYFHTTALRNVRRTVQWRIGTTVVFAERAQKYFEYVPIAAVSRERAARTCARRYHLQMRGSLALHVPSAPHRTGAPVHTMRDWKKRSTVVAQLRATPFRYYYWQPLLLLRSRPRLESRAARWKRAVRHFARLVRYRRWSQSHLGFWCEYGGRRRSPQFSDRGDAVLLAACGWSLFPSWCAARRRCAWNPLTDRCVDNHCIDRATPTECRAAQVCAWDADSSRPHRCGLQFCYATFTSANRCDAETSCLWRVPATGEPHGCHRRICPSYSMQRDCTADPSCFWDSTWHGGASGACVAMSYSACGGLDVLLMVQAPASEAGEVFHSHIEAIRRWLPTLTLTGSPWGKQQGASTGMRISTFVFGRRTHVGWYHKGSAPAAGFVPSAAVGDAFTGRYDEAEREIGWYQSFSRYLVYRNYQGYGFVNSGLRMASHVLEQGATTPQRRKAVVVFARSNFFYDAATVSAFRALPSEASWVVARSNEPGGEAACRHPLARLTASCHHAVRIFDSGVALEHGLGELCRRRGGWRSATMGGGTSCRTRRTETACRQDRWCNWGDRGCE
jgi:hypothetical protein